MFRRHEQWYYFGDDRSIETRYLLIKILSSLSKPIVLKKACREKKLFFYETERLNRKEAERDNVKLTEGDRELHRYRGRERKEI